MGYIDFGQPPYVLRKHFDDNTDQWTKAQLIFPGGVCSFSHIPSGTFFMGSPASEAGREPTGTLKGNPFGREPRHEVVISKAFWLCRTTCTQKLWTAVMGGNPSHFKHDDKPVESVGWYDVMRFIERLNGANRDLKTRLPTEAEWEYACRAGTSTPFSLGKNDAGEATPGITITPLQANYDGSHLYPGGVRGENRKQTMPVQHFRPNAWNLYQMHGNVREWCEDACDVGLTTKKVKDPKKTAPGQDTRFVLRGGSWQDSPDMLRAAARCFSYHEITGSHVGFRLALDL